MAFLQMQRGGGASASPLGWLGVGLLAGAVCAAVGVWSAAADDAVPAEEARALAAAAAEDESLPERVEFNRDVRPILSDRCFACHGPGSKNDDSDLRLDQRESAVASGAIAPGDVEASELLARIASDDRFSQMPPPESKLERLTEREVAIVRRWIEQGAEYQPHWSFIPLKPVEVPRDLQAGDNNERPLHPIDALVRRRLQDRGWQQQPEADRAALMRRVSFDLTGLPPTVEELEAFLADDSPDAYERLVDRLLASPRYGERMAADWLDVARYADSYGFQVDRERTVWMWRDWVIKAFNENLPYDEFIVWQLAGDLLPDATDEQILATAFNRLHQQESEGGSVEEEYRVEHVADRVHTFSMAFLGLTLECARCHDHKYDPLTHREFYQLFSMFQNIDEAGLYAFFTQSVPTPTLLLAGDDAKRNLAALSAKVEELEAAEEPLRTSRREAFEAWLAARQRGAALELADLAAHFTFDEAAETKLANAVEGGQPAVMHGGNKLVPGRFGAAVEFTGDDSVALPLGNFNSFQPFSVLLWMKTPDVKERAVVMRRSPAWTDAASRGYELLLENGQLKWSLIHFWPGNAVSIATREPVAVNEWLHVVVASDGSGRAAGLKLYVNGELAATEVIRDNLTKDITGGGHGGDNIALGERFRDRGFTGGAIDDLRVVVREIMPIEAAALFDAAAAQAIVDKPADELSQSERELLFDYYLSTADDEWKQHLTALFEARKARTTAYDHTGEIMVMRELPEPKKAYVLFRGEYNQPREEVFAGTPAVLPPMPEGAPRNRLGLAQWLVSREHPLTARVTVNRFWQNIFGQGLVKTSEDFGSQGSPPVHGELLDWLALHFIESGWDTKALLKTIVMSETYRQCATAAAELVAEDPANEWLARGPRFRLPAEMIRDNALASAGLLKHHVGGAPVHPYELSEAFKPVSPSGGDGVYRRSLYTFWRRTGPPPALIAFDAPRRAVCTVKRERTESPLQALILLNGVQYVEAARVLGETLHTETNGDLDAIIEQAFLRCLSRKPDARETEIAKRLYEEQLVWYNERAEEAAELLKIGQTPRNEQIPAPQAAAAAVLMQALMNHDECVVKR